MNSKQIEAYKFYRDLYPSVLLLFHPSDGYVAMFDDARRAAETLSIDIGAGEEMITFPDTDIGLISKLGANGTEVHIIDYRNDEGKRDFPDIERLKREQSEDY